MRSVPAVAVMVPIPTFFAVWLGVLPRVCCHMSLRVVVRVWWWTVWVLPVLLVRVWVFTCALGGMSCSFLVGVVLNVVFWFVFADGEGFCCFGGFSVGECVFDDFAGYFWPPCFCSCVFGPAAVYAGGFGYSDVEEFVAVSVDFV